MGILCFKPGFSEEAIVNAIYPSNANDDIIKANLDKLTMQAISKPLKLVTISNLLERNIKNHLYKKKYNSAIIGAKAMDALVTACHNDISMFISSVQNVVKMLLENDVHPPLQVKAFETLGVTLQSSTHKNNFGQFADKLIACTSFEKSQDAQLNYRVRIAAMRALARMLNDHSILDSFPLSKAIPEVLKNMNEQGSDTSPEFELRTTVSLNDKSLTITQGHLNKAADDCLAYIADTINASKADRMMHPIIEYLDAKKAWTHFAMHVIQVLLEHSQFAQFGYTMSSFLISHVDVVPDADHRVSIMLVVKQIILKQNNKSVISPLAIEQNYAFLRQLISYADNDAMKRLHETILECITLVAKRSANTPQNTNLINGTLLVLSKSKQQADISDAAVSLLLTALSNICNFAAAVPVGKHYPDSIIKTMCEFAVSFKPRHRELLLQAFQGLVKSPTQTAIDDKELSQSDAKIHTNADSKNVTASISVKQREEVYVSMFKAALLADNQASNFSEFLITIVIMLKQYKNKELEFGVPCMIGLTDTLLAMPPEKSQAIGARVQNLIAAYFYVLSQIYNHKEMAKYIEEIVAQRAKVNNCKQQFCDALKKVAESEQRVDLASMFENGAQNWNTPEQLIQKERIIEYLSSIESLKQSYPNLNEVLLKKFPSDYNVFSAAEVQSSNPVQDDDVFQNDEVSISDSNTLDNIPVDDDEWKRVNAAQVIKHDYMILGGTTVNKQLKAQKQINDLLTRLAHSKGASGGAAAAAHTNMNMDDTASDTDDVADDADDADDADALASKAVDGNNKNNSIDEDATSTLTISMPRVFIFDSITAQN